MADTSLAQQLRRLAVPQTSILLSDKKKASLLFDPKEASNLDPETVLEIGVSGLRELVDIGGPEFGYFEKDLFDTTSIGVERAVLTKEGNEALDERIHKFLVLLSPYALLKPCHKALEWLIRRFHINEYNQDKLIFLFLPYHESKIFVRILQLIDVSSPSHRWHWLHALRQAGTSLPHSTIVGHASANNFFLAALCEHVLFAIKVYKVKASILSTLFGFYCTTVVGAIEHVQKKRKGSIESAKEAQLQVILPCLLKGLQSVIPDFACASFMIVSSLTRSGFMAQKLLHKIINKIVKNCNDSTFMLKEVAALLALLCETQSSTQVCIFPSSALKKLLTCDVLTPLIGEAVSMSTVAHVGNFTMVLIVGLLPLAKESVSDELAPVSRKALDDIVSTVPMEKNFSQEAIRLFVNALADAVEEEKKGKEFTDQSYLSWLNNLLRSIETKYPTAFDSVVQKLVMSKGNENSKMASIVGRLLGISVLNKEEFGALVERLCHPEAGVRVAALQKLAEMDVAALKSEEDKQTLMWIVEQRLSDDCPKVIKGSLSLPFLDSIFGRGRLVNQATEIVVRASRNMTHSSEREKWLEVAQSAIGVMFAEGVGGKGSEGEPKSILEQRLKVLFSVFPFLCPTSEEELKVTQEILKLPCSDPMLESLWRELSDKSDINSCCCAAFNHLLQFESLIAAEKLEVIDLVETLSSHCVQDGENAVGLLIAMLILSAIAKVSSLSIKSRVLEIVIQVVNQSKVAITRTLKDKPIKHVLTGETWGSCMTTAKGGDVPLQAVLHCYASVFHSSQSSWFPSSPTKLNAWDSHNGLLNAAPTEPGHHTAIAVKIFDALAFGCFLRKVEKSLPKDVADAQMLYVGCLKDFFDAHLPQLSHQLKFLSCLWVAHEIPLSGKERMSKESTDFGRLTIHSETKEYVYYHSTSQSGCSISPELQIRALRLAEALISKASVSTSWLLEMDGMGTAIIPSILVACTSPVTSVRAATMSLLRSLVSSVGANLPNKGSLYTPLVKELVEQSEEILLDSGQLPLVLYTHLSPEPAILALHSAEKRQQMAKIRDSLFSILSPDSPAPCFIKRALLQILYGIRSLDVLKQLCQLGLALLEVGQGKSAMDEYSTDCFTAIISRFDSTIAPHMGDSKKGCSPLWTFFKNALSDTMTELPATEDVKQFQLSTSDFMKVICPAILCLQQVTREFYDALPSQNNRLEILSLMIDIASQSNAKSSLSNPKDFPLAEAASLAAKSAIKKLSIDANLIVEELEKMLTFEEDPGKRRASLRKPVKRVVPVLTPKDLQSQSWMRGVVLLEIMQTKKKVKNPQLILPLLFELLKACLQLKHQEPVEYTKQLILACALHCLRKLNDRGEDEDDNDSEPKKIDKNQLDVETIVHCIRSTQNPHTHRHALLLLSRAAELAPDSVLHNVMAIFAFVGTSMVRQDDEYSFEVISRTIESVIPVLTKVDLHSQTRSLPRKKGSEGGLGFLEGPGAAGVLKVTRVFADAVPDVPPHRRLPLYVKLVETVGWDVGLPQLLLLVLEGHVLHGKSKASEKDDSSSNLDSRIELAHEMVRETPPYFIVSTLLRMVEFVNVLPADKESGGNGKVLWHSRQAAQSKQLTHDFSHVFDVKIRTGAQLRHFKHAVLSFLLDVISEPQIVAKVSLVDEVDSEMVKDRQGVDMLFQDLIQVLLGYIATVAGELDVAGGSNPSGRYWKAMQQRCHQILEKVNSLLPGSLFLTVVRGLLGYQLPSVRRKAADILSNRLLALLSEKGTPAEACTSFSEDDRASLQGILLGPLVDLMHSREKTQIDSTASKENDLNCQVSLFTVKLLVRILGPVEKPAVLKEVLSHVTKVASGALAVEGSLVPSSSSVLASAVLCIAEICSVMKVNALSELNNFMPVLLSALSSNMKDSTNTTAQIGVVTAVQRVVESIPNFISPYLKILLVRLCLFTSQQMAGDVSEGGLLIKNEQLSLKLASILNKVASAIPLRVLIPAVSDSYAVLSEGKYASQQNVTPSKDGKKRKRHKSTPEGETEETNENAEVLPKKSECHMAIIPLMDMFSHSLSEMKRADLNSHLPDLEHFFLNALDFRVKNRNVDSSEVVEKVEASLISALIVLVMKLSEAMFRSLYYRLFEWTSGDKAPRHRAISFYRFSSKCAEALKGLFVLFAGHCIRHAASLLDLNNLAKISSNEEKETGSVKEDSEESADTPKDNTLYFGEEDADGSEAHSLIKCILSMLHSVFLYEDGTGRFVTAGRFETLMPPLVNQLENLVGGMDLFQERCSAHVVPTLVKFAVSAADDSLWKQLNYQILLKTRHSNPKVRLAGLSALLELGKQLGEDFLPLLPETVPFLAELMEDEEEEVEAAAQKAIATLSDVLGEPLQKYL